MKARSYLTSFFVAGILLFTAGCNNETQLKAWGMIDSGALLVDVRTPGEFNAGHLPGARLIPVNEVSARISEFGADKDRPIVVYCKSGNRSGQAEGILKAAGFTNVYNGGGYNALMSAKSERENSKV